MWLVETVYPLKGIRLKQYCSGPGVCLAESANQIIYAVGGGFCGFSKGLPIRF